MAELLHLLNPNYLSIWKKHGKKTWSFPSCHVGVPLNHHPASSGFWSIQLLVKTGGARCQARVWPCRLAHQAGFARKPSPTKHGGFVKRMKLHFTWWGHRAIGMFNMIWGGGSMILMILKHVGNEDNVDETYCISGHPIFRQSIQQQQRRSWHLGATCWLYGWGLRPTRWWPSSLAKLAYDSNSSWQHVGYIELITNHL